MNLSDTPIAILISVTGKIPAAAVDSAFWPVILSIISLSDFLL
jgi:hypothetical protein